MATPINLSATNSGITDITANVFLHFNGNTLNPGTGGFFALNSSSEQMCSFKFYHNFGIIDGVSTPTPIGERYRLQILTNEYEDSKIYFEANDKKLFKYLLINDDSTIPKPILLLWDISKYKSKGLTLSNSLSESISNLNIYGDDIYKLNNNEELTGTDSITANSNSFTLYAYNGTVYIESTFVLPLAGCTIQRVANGTTGFDIQFVLPSDFTDNSTPRVVLRSASTPYKLFTIDNTNGIRTGVDSEDSPTLKYGLNDDGNNQLSFIGNNATIATVLGTTPTYHDEYRETDVYEYFEQERFDEINYVLYKNTLCLNTSTSTKPNYYKNGDTGTNICLIKVHNNIPVPVPTDFYTTVPTINYVNYVRDYNNSLEVINGSNIYDDSVNDKDQYIYHVNNTTQNYITSRLYVFKASAVPSASVERELEIINNNISVSPNSNGILIDKYNGDNVVNKYFIKTTASTSPFNLFIDSGKYDLYYFTTTIVDESTTTLTLNKGWITGVPPQPEPIAYINSSVESEIYKADGVTVDFEGDGIVNDTSVYISGSESIHMSNASAQRLEINKSNLGSGPHTIMLWFKDVSGATGGGYNNIIIHGTWANADTPPARKGYKLEYSTVENHISFGGSLGLPASLSNSDFNHWIFVAVTLDPDTNTAIMYYKSVSHSDVQTIETSLSSDYEDVGDDGLTINGEVISSNVVGGTYYDEIRVFDEVLSYDDINYYYGLTSPNTLGFALMTISNYASLPNSMQGTDFHDDGMHILTGDGGTLSEMHLYKLSTAWNQSTPADVKLGITTGLTRTRAVCIIEITGDNTVDKKATLVAAGNHGEFKIITVIMDTGELINDEVYNSHIEDHNNDDKITYMKYHDNKLYVVRVAGRVDIYNIIINPQGYKIINSLNTRLYSVQNSVLGIPNSLGSHRHITLIKWTSDGQHCFIGCEPGGSATTPRSYILKYYRASTLYDIRTLDYVESVSIPGTYRGVHVFFNFNLNEATGDIEGLINDSSSTFRSTTGP